MKNTLIPILFLMPFFGIKAQNTARTNNINYKLSLEIEHQGKAGGNIMIAIFKEANGFRNPDKAALLKIMPAAEKPMTGDFSLEPGSYAIAVYHDLNSNGKLDFHWSGLPSEPYGFSNNPKILFGPPTFHDCLVQLNQNRTIAIKLR